jgi:hypothetical protein
MAAGTIDPATTPPGGALSPGGISPATEPSIGELVGNITTGLSSLVRQEVELAKAELRGEIAKIGFASVLLVLAAVAGTLVLPFLSVAAMFALGQVMALYWAALIVAGGWLLLAAICGGLGALRLRGVHPVPEKAIAAAKEDLQWLRDRKN